MERSSKYIKDIFLFNTLSPEILNRIAGFCTILTSGKGEHLFFEGDRASAFFYIISGKVKIYRLSAQGQEQILEIIEEGNLVAEAAIFDSETYPAYCLALEESTLIRIPRNEFILLIEQKPDVALKIMHAYSKRLRYFVSMVEKLSMQDIKSRLARYFLDHSQRKGGKDICRIPVTKKELAALLGTIPETLSRALRSLKDDGLIEVSGSVINILDRARLGKVVQ